jgi:hypothetical protein
MSYPEKDKKKKCEICTYKFSCGYSALRRGQKTDGCCEPHLFKKVKVNYWSPKNQKLESLEQIAKEEKDCFDHAWFFRDNKAEVLL